MSRDQPSQPLSGQMYAIIALVGLLFGVGLLLFYVYEVPRLAENSAQNQVYYLLLIPWALSCAAFLFGAMRSYARFTHKQVGNALELGGPVVLFALVIVGGYKLVPQPSPTFDLTVRPYGKDGGDAVITTGRITIDLDTDRRTESVDSEGEANFKGIPSRFQGATLRILPQVDGYTEEWQRHKIRGNVLQLPLVRQAKLMTRLTGSIIPPSKQSVVKIIVAGQNVEALPDEFGRFELNVNGKIGDRVRLQVYADGELAYDDYQVLPGPVMLKLHPRR